MHAALVHSTIAAGTIRRIDAGVAEVGPGVLDVITHENAPVLAEGDRSPRRGPRPRCTVRAALVEAGLELARSGGPDAVVLREVTRMVAALRTAS